MTDKIEKMLTHSQIWAAIDGLAVRYDLSVSGLAKKAGLDPTTFNKSKRITNDGRDRWPSTESVAKVLQATHTSITDFVYMIAAGHDAPTFYTQNDRMALEEGFSESSDDFVTTGNYIEIFLKHCGDNSLVIDDFEDHMSPFYREGDILIVNQQSKFQTGDRIVIKLSNQTFVPGIFEKQNKSSLTLSFAHPDYSPKTFKKSEFTMIGRIVWVRQ